MKLSASQLPQEVQAAAEQLLSNPLPDEQLDNGIDYYVEERRKTRLGRTAIQLSSGSFGGDDGYEGYASSTTLVYGKDDRLKSVVTEEAFEPGGPLLNIKDDIVDHVSAIFRAIMQKPHRSERKELATHRAAGHIAQALFRRGDKEAGRQLIKSTDPLYKDLQHTR